MKTNRITSWCRAVAQRSGVQCRGWVGALLVGAFVTTMAGCASDRAPRSAGETIDDQAISRRVQEALSSDPAYKFTDVKVVTYRGKVQLSGFVDRDEQKGQAEEIAKTVRGVKEVQNQIVKK